MPIKKLLIYCFALLLSWFFIHLIYTSIDGLKTKNGKADLAVILGNKVNRDGTLSERLKQRLNCGFSLYKSGLIPKVLVSGGLGKEGFYEGTIMKAYLVKKGIPTANIIVDNNGANTEATVINTLKLKDSLGFNSIIVVSQYFHLTRTKMLFRKNGFNAVKGASPNYFEWRDCYALTREFFAYYFG